MKRLILILWVCSVLTLAARPSWFDDTPPNPNLIYGRGSASMKDRLESEARQEAVNEAYSDIARQIVSEVKAYSQTYETEGMDTQSLYLKNIQVESCVQLCSQNVVRSETDRKTKIYYTILSVQKDALINHYMTMLRHTSSEALATFEGSMALLDSNPKAARQGLEKLRGQLLEIEYQMRILSAMYKGSVDAMVENLDQLPRMGVVESHLAQLIGNPLQSYEDLAEDLINQIRPELQQAQSYVFSAFEWEDTGFSSSFLSGFSRVFTAMLENRFRWRQFRGPGNPDIILTGHLFEEGNKINIMAKITGSANQTLFTQISPASIEYFGLDKIKPQDLEEKLAAQNLVINEAIQKGQLNIKAMFAEFPNTTAMYTLGDKINLLVRVNKPCYITVVNIEADGRWNRIFENHFIAEDMCNQWIPLFTNVTVTYPTGVEQLFIQASGDRIPGYEVVKEKVQGGTKDIIVGKYTELAKTRGLMMSEPDEVESTETYITWTILER